MTRLNQVTDDRNAYTFSTRVRVRLSETDAVGIAFFGSFASWMDVGRMDYLNHLELTPKDAAVPGLVPGAVAGCHIEFRSPVRYNDELLIEVRVAELGRSSYTFHFLFRQKSSGELVARGELTLVWLNAEFRPEPIPDSFTGPVRQFEGDHLD